MPYSGRNLTSGPDRHIHEGEVELMPGESVTVSKSSVCAKLANAEITVKNDRMMPGFNHAMMTVNGDRCGQADTVGMIAAAIGSGTAVFTNTGDKKSLVSFRLLVVATEPKKEPPTQPGVGG